MKVDLQMSAFNGGKGARKVTLRVGPNILGEALLSDQVEWHSVVLPPDSGPLTRPLVLELDSIISPKAAGLSSDPRLLGVGLHAMRWSNASP
jgi:hypothetical protein